MGGGRNRGVNLPSSYFLSQFLPPPYFLFPHPGPSSSILPTPNFSFSPFSLPFPPISPSSQLFLGYFSLLPRPVLFLPPPMARSTTPGGRFSKVPKTFRARKAFRKTPTCLSCNAGLFICCKGNKNKSNCEVSCLETPSFWRYKENYVTRNGPEKFRDFRETGSWRRSWW